MAQQHPEMVQDWTADDGAQFYHLRQHGDIKATISPCVGEEWDGQVYVRVDGIFTAEELSEIVRVMARFATPLEDDDE